MAVDIDADTLIAEARADTGLDDLGDTGVRERLAIQVAAVEADTGLSGLGRWIIRERLLGLLRARLRFEDFVRRNPESLEVELEPPVIVVGLRRSGTTHLVNLLAADTRFRAMPWWEVREPVPVLGDGPGPDGVDPRFARTFAEWEITKATAPLTALMHDRPPWSIEEDCELVDLDVCSYTLEWHARVPLWRDHYLGLDQRPHYQFLRRQLQVLSYLRGPNRWVLKTPQHLEQLGPLLDVFPDATVAFTLRDPVAVLQSAITMLAYGDRLRRVHVGADELAAYWVDRVERLLRAAVRDAELIPAAQRVDVEFGEFMADDLAMASRILDVAGLELTNQGHDKLSRYLAGNPRGKEGRVAYDLRADFGIEPADLYDRFGFYLDGVPPDPTGGRLMSGIHRERPGAEAITACSGEPAIELGDGIWMSPGLSNSYLLATDDGRVILNTGMGFEGALHHRAFDRVGSGPLRTIILTQGHYDHVGGVDVLREPGTDVVAQANWATWRDDNERLEAFRAENAAFAWMDAVLAAMAHAESLGIGAVAQARPEPTITFDDSLELTIGGRTLQLLSVPGGETTDSLAVWLPESRTVFTGNMTGPLFGHVPNLVTMRGDRYRDPLVYVASLERARALRPNRLITGHFDPIEAAEVIDLELTAMRDLLLHVHDRTVEGMNTGVDVQTLMRDITHPEHLDVGEGYGKTSWNVRAIWEQYSGWFHHRSTTELYAVPSSAVAADIVEAAGECVLMQVAETHVREGRPLNALHLTDVVLAAEPTHAEARRVAAAASRALLDDATNFWERAWLTRSLKKLEATS